MRLPLLFILISASIGTSALTLNKPSLVRKNPLLRNASFAETYERYPSVYDVIQRYLFIFPGLPNTNYDCLLVTDKNAPVYGAIDPQSGTALQEVPDPMFYSRFQFCVRDLLQSGTNDFVAFSKPIFGEAGLKVLKDKVNAICAANKKPYYCFIAEEDRVSNVFNFTKWNELDKDFQLFLMKSFVRYLAGPERILRKRNLIGAENVFSQPLASEPDLVNFLLGIAKELKSSDNPNETASIRSVYAEIAVLFTLGPSLKN